MNYRKILLRVVFWALGLAAAFGAAGVIFAGHDTLWRIVGTCAATAVGALLILAASRLLDLEVSWLPGVMMVWFTVIEYLAVLGSIWNVFGSAEERAGMTMLFLAATAIPAIGFSRVMRQPEAVVLTRVALCACAAVFALLMVGTWTGWQAGVHERNWRWHTIGLSLACFAMLAVLSLLGAGTDRRHWRWLGVVASAIGFSISAYAIAFDIHQSSAFFVCVVSVAAVVGHANVMMWCPVKSAQRWLLWGTIGAGIATGTLVDFGRITSPWQEEMLGRLAGAAAIIAGCGTLAILVLARIHRPFAPAKMPSLADLREINLMCPRCRSKQRLTLGLGKCATCGLLIEVRVHEQEKQFNELAQTGMITHPV